MRISIPTPCNEKWSEMTPNEQGSFCAVCSKTVIDFTSMPDDDVKNYFLNNTRNICGRFRNDQLHYENEELKNVLQMPIPVWKKIIAAVFILFGALLTSCDTPKMGKVAGSNDQEVCITTGIIQMPVELVHNDSILSSKIEIDTLSTTVGILMIEPRPIVGEIEVDRDVDTATARVSEILPENVSDTVTGKSCNDKSGDFYY